jgi:hypothetical protein
MARRVEAPDFLISAMIGKTLPAARSASALIAATTSLRAASICGFPSLTPFAFAAASADLVWPEIKARSFFSQRGIEVQDEGIDVRPQLRDDEGHAMRHQSGNEMHVAREAIEFGDQDRAPHRPRLGERRRQLRPAIERVASLAGLDLGELRREVEARLAGEPAQRVRAALRCRD